MLYLFWCYTNYDTPGSEVVRVLSSTWDGVSFGAFTTYWDLLVDKPTPHPPNDQQTVTGPSITISSEAILALATAYVDVSANNLNICQVNSILASDVVQPFSGTPTVISTGTANAYVTSDFEWIADSPHSYGGFTWIVGVIVNVAVGHTYNNQVSVYKDGVIQDQVNSPGELIAEFIKTVVFDDDNGKIYIFYRKFSSNTLQCVIFNMQTLSYGAPINSGLSIDDHPNPCVSRGDGDIAIFFQNGSDASLWYAIFTVATGTWGASAVMDATLLTGNRAVAALTDSNGLIHVAYERTFGGVLSLRHITLSVSNVVGASSLINAGGAAESFVVGNAAVAYGDLVFAGISNDGLTVRMFVGTPSTDSTPVWTTLTVPSPTGSQGQTDAHVALAYIAAPVITTSTLPTLTVNVPMTLTFTGTGSADLIWSVVTGSLPPGLTLDSATGILSGTPTNAGTYPIQVQLASSSGAGAGGGGFAPDVAPFTLVVNPPPDTVPGTPPGPGGGPGSDGSAPSTGDPSGGGSPGGGIPSSVPAVVTDPTPGTSGDTPTPGSPWIPGNCWDISTPCARTGAYGLRRVAPCISGDSSTISTQQFAVTPGQSYYLEFFVKTGNSADGVLSFGLNFYDSAGVFVSFLGVDSSGSPSVWTMFSGLITVPLTAATASPAIKATGHTTGSWCVNSLFTTIQDEYFLLMSIKHYFDNYTAYR